MTTFHVKVEPGQDAFTVDMSGTYPRITLTEPADQGRSNAELIARLTRILDADIHIVSGHKSRRKKLSTTLDQEAVQERLAAHMQG